MHRSLLLFLALVGRLCAATWEPGARVQDEVLQVVRSYEKAVNSADATLWLSIWDLQYEDLTILENDKSQVLGRRYVERIAEGLKASTPQKRQTWHTNKVILLNPDLAYILSQRTEHNMPDHQKESRITLVVRRNADGWKIIQCHFSFIPQ